MTEEDRLASAFSLVFGWGIVIGIGVDVLRLAGPWRDAFLADGVLFILGGAAGLGGSYTAARILEILGCLTFAISFVSILFGL